LSTVTPNFNWPVPTSTDLVKDGATAIEALGDSIDASLVDLKGGTSGQVLSKNSNTDMDFVWVTSDDANAIQNTIVDAKGDLITATAADTPARLAVGTNGHILVADSATATGLKWAAPAAGGKVLQVIHASYNSTVASSTTTFADTGLSATITPSATSSKVLVIITQNGCDKDNTVNQSLRLKLFRGATELTWITDNLGKVGSSTAEWNQGFTLATTWLDSPSSTSALTYKTQFSRAAGSGSVYVQNYNTTGGSSVSTITLMEIGA
jgi:hypothetical protein